MPAVHGVFGARRVVPTLQKPGLDVVAVARVRAHGEHEADTHDGEEDHDLERRVALQEIQHGGHVGRVLLGFLDGHAEHDVIG